MAVLTWPLATDPLGLPDTAGNANKLQRTPDDGSVVSQVRDGAKRGHVTDQIGSTIALLNSTGNVTRSYSYDTDGNDTASRTGSTTQIRYAGGHDIGNGLIHYGHRYYQPSIGRWTQQNLLLQPNDLGQANRYSYVANDPLNAVDPQGTVRIFGAEVKLKDPLKTVLRAGGVYGCAKYVEKGYESSRNLVTKGPAGATFQDEVDGNRQKAEEAISCLALTKK